MATSPAGTSTTYPFLCQAPDGAIVVLYDRRLRELGGQQVEHIHEIVRVDPDWLAGTAGRAVGQAAE